MPPEPVDSVAAVDITRSDGVITIYAGDIGKKVVVIGQLGLPIGRTVTVSGYYVGAGQTLFQVETVNGQKSDCQIMLKHADTEKPDEGHKATLEGYEFGTLSSTLENGTTYPTDRYQTLSTCFSIYRQFFPLFSPT